MADIELKDHEFGQFRRLIFQLAGISLSPAKKALVQGRLSKRLEHHGVASFTAYYRFLQLHPAERQLAVDLLTTNETYFFREPRHFHWLQQHVLSPRRDRTSRPSPPLLRLWSAAASSGEEAYSMAMSCADILGWQGWEVLGSDISHRVLDKARRGLYEMTRTDGIPEHYLKTFCLKGTGQYAGHLLVDPKLREKVRFVPMNLNDVLPDVGEFDVIFLRNVLIYFSMETKQQVLDRLIRRLRTGGWLFVGHSETLNGIDHKLVQKAPAVYQKVSA
ncbi:CheR family methyltransferase [Ectothiorhodospira lacustris]|uniref:CheR family methyltransferase n=1 Tax=Ectothiorhodospira lacustris TaxID=2899127 RepID=UPI001EE97314|nr:protein-glutamate O-methyltransferase CheR [Ectothiorhodospira lacustris]MCG5500938.1 protein-glutamate O-methyltransferase CheR [Ectothiorhodospira lacustris]MCG5510699.1 protein-glutamate O-methyltransferase CheR [Ectothiorhodospira lacustris]MCG5522401.1 protein-glutamate O-methyltransferase CheR [Ectothiorhodospira lacustris]